MPPLPQWTASWKLPLAMSAFHAFTVAPSKVALMPASFSSWAMSAPSCA